MATKGTTGEWLAISIQKERASSGLRRAQVRSEFFDVASQQPAEFCLNPKLDLVVPHEAACLVQLDVDGYGTINTEGHWSF